MNKHILHVREDVKYSEMFPDYPKCVLLTLSCPEGNGCSGFQECWGPGHEVNGKTVGDPDDPEVTDEDEPWAGAEEFEMHGAVHTWRGGWGWTLPITGCVVRFNDWEAPDHARGLPYGDYEVDVEWDEEFPIMTFTHPNVADLAYAKSKVVTGVYANDQAREIMDRILTKWQVS